MSVFVDTSALIPLLQAEEVNHRRASALWQALRERDEHLVTSNYVVLESFALLQRRMGLEVALRFETEFRPTLDVAWVDEAIHDSAVSLLFVHGRRHLSLVDCVSFEVMRRLRIATAFTFDPHFRDQGFECLP